MSNLIFKSIGNTTVKLIAVGTPYEISLSANNSAYQIGQEIALSNNQQVEFAGTNQHFSKDFENYYKFVVTGTGTVSLWGEVMSLVGQNVVNDSYQFINLFAGCDKITSIQYAEINATSMKDFCFSNMFKDCTGLITPPSSLPATTLANWCYQGMFAGCTSMTTAPALPAETLAKYCYYAMFYNCKSLTEAPLLPAETLTDWCYNSMFWGCQKLSSIVANFTDWNIEGNSTKSWIVGTASTGYFECINVEDIRDNDHIPSGWTYQDGANIPFTVKSIGENSFQSTSQDLSYNKNKTGWTAYTPGTYVNLVDGDECAFNKSANTMNWTGTGKLKIYGNINSRKLLTSYDNYFNGNTRIVDASRLYFTYGSCKNMFRNCTNLSAIPKIWHRGDWSSAHSFSGMFKGCTSLSTVPTNLFRNDSFRVVNNECKEMFAGCTSLTNAPYLKTGFSVSQGFYDSMFSGCTSLTTVPVDLLPATGMASGCYQYMFAGCTSLTNAPTLPATTLANWCYVGMFMSCSSLMYAPNLPATILSDDCYYKMFLDCKSLKTAPTLPATILRTNSYANMFQGCTSLSSIEVNFTDWGTGPNTYYWVDDGAAEGTFTKPTDLPLSTGISYIPEGWTVISH